MENSLKIRTFKQQSNLYYYIVANARQSTPQYVSKSMVFIPGTLEWAYIYHVNTRLLIYNYTGECQISLR